MARRSAVGRGRARTGKECLYFEGQVVYDATQKHSCRTNHCIMDQASRVDGGFFAFHRRKAVVFFLQPTPPHCFTREAILGGAV